MHLNWHTLALCNLRKCFPGRRWVTYVFNIIILPNCGIDPETGCAKQILDFYMDFEFGVGVIIMLVT